MMLTLALAPGAAWWLFPEVASELQGPDRDQACPSICLTLKILSPPLLTIR